MQRKGIGLAQQTPSLPQNNTSQGQIYKRRAHRMAARKATGIEMCQMWNYRKPLRKKDLSVVEESWPMFTLETRAVIQQFPNSKDWIDGYTDSIGRSKKNLALSKERAVAVKRWLVKKKGLLARNITTEGFGEEKLVAPNKNSDNSDNPEGRAQKPARPDHGGKIAHGCFLAAEQMPHAGLLAYATAVRSGGPTTLQS
jgi:hypothetical protein